MKYRKKAVEVEAIQWKGDMKEVSEFLELGNSMTLGRGYHFMPDVNNHGLPILIIQTLEGKMKASTFDYIIKGVNGEFYPCKPDIFNKTYEPV
jgi:hypothetical protein